MAFLEIENINKTFHGENNSKTVALSDLNFSCNEGEFVVILGSTGCGKTTLLRLIAGLEKPDSGSTVKVSYEGKLLDGFIFDGTTDTQSLASLPLAFTILGWQEGVPLIGVGGKIQLYIPSHLAYGNQPPTNTIPKNAILIFDIELVSFE